MIEIKYRTFWRRVLASLIDGFIFVPIYITVEWFANANDIILWVAIDIAVILAYQLYMILMHGKFGQTIGKKISKVKVLDVSESKFNMRQAFLRDIVLVVLSILHIAILINRVSDGTYREEFDPLEGTALEKLSNLTENDYEKMTPEEIQELLDDISKESDQIDVDIEGFLTSPEMIIAYCSIAWMFLEFLTMLFNKKRRAIHDFIARSVVVRV